MNIAGLGVSHVFVRKRIQIALFNELHDNVGTVSAIVMDFNGPGVGKRTFANDFKQFSPCKCKDRLS